MLTIAFLSHHSKHLILKNIEKIFSYNLNVSIIIVENSLDHSFKKDLESKYSKNIKIYVPKENLGFAGGMNKAIELSDNQFVFLNPADVSLSYDCIKGLVDCITHLKDFTLLAPTYNNETIFKNYDENIFSKKKFRKNNFKILKKYNVKEVDWIDQTFVVNKSTLDNPKLMDENFFLYFETMDMCLNLKNKNKKMYVIDNLKFDHIGGASHEKKYNYAANLSRNWHYNWSKFYYFKKNYSYLYALKKLLPKLIKLFLKYIFNVILKKDQSGALIKAEIKGLTTSFLLKKSSYRPFIDS